MRLAEDVAVEYGDLVGADHQVLRIASGQRFGLAGGKAAHQFLGTFPGAMAFVDIGAGAFEGKAQAGQEFASVGELEARIRSGMRFSVASGRF